jgi:hypothetical protein
MGDENKGRQLILLIIQELCSIVLIKGEKRKRQIRGRHEDN